MFLNVIRKTYQQLKRAFPNTRIIPSIGNHELVPEGSFTPPCWVHNNQFTVSWLVSELYSSWKDWLPQSANSTFFKGGDFSVLIRPGLRVISLNTIYCYQLNWGMYVDSTNPCQQLEWLSQQLQDAKNFGDIGHVPPGDSTCLEMWSRNYYKIANRYQGTITAHFHGHTHFDEFKVFYDDINYARPISVSYVTLSLTSYVSVNPAYRNYYIDDESTREVIDYDTCILDLDKANRQTQNVLPWFCRFSVKNEYNLTNLRPNEWNNLIPRMNLLQKFYQNYHRYSSVAQPATQAERKQFCVI